MIYYGGGYMNNCISMSELNSCVCNNSYYDQNGTNYCCRGIKPYCSSDCCNQCGKCFCCNCCCCCCPIVPTGPMPPMPPLPPIPPPIPGGNFAQFNAPTQVLDDGELYRFNLINIQGDPVQFDPATGHIILKPNTTYRYSYVTETILQGVVPSDLENALVLNNASILGTESTANNVQPGVLTVLQSNGQFVSTPNQNILRLGFSTNPPVQGETSATLTIEEVLP